MVLLTISDLLNSTLTAPEAGQIQPPREPPVPAAPRDLAINRVLGHLVEVPADETEFADLLAYRAELLRGQGTPVTDAHRAAGSAARHALYALQVQRQALEVGAAAPEVTTAWLHATQAYVDHLDQAAAAAVAALVELCAGDAVLAEGLVGVSLSPADRGSGPGDPSNPLQLT